MREATVCHERMYCETMQHPKIVLLRSTVQSLTAGV